jgi:flagellar P-ring protein precursor FlgI
MKRKTIFLRPLKKSVFWRKKGLSPNGDCPFLFRLRGFSEVLFLFVLIFNLVLGLLVECQATTPGSSSESLNQVISVRVKDIAHLYEAKENQLTGLGIIIGLKNTGDSQKNLFTKELISNFVKNMGIQIPASNTSRNIAAVIVTTNLKPFMKIGNRLDVTVSSVGDATSLEGGTLLMTPLQGADNLVYAVAQGPVSIGGLVESSSVSTYRKNIPTVGRIPEGAIVEKEVPVTVTDPNFLTLVLDRPDFTTASRLAYALITSGIEGAKAIDATTVKIPLNQLQRENVVDYIARIEEVRLTPDTGAKIVINERTGTIVVGAAVKIAPVAVTHGNLSVRVGQPSLPGVAENPASEIQPVEENTKLVKLDATSCLSDLVKALNSIGASPRDLIDIIQAMKAAGAISAEIEII